MRDALLSPAVETAVKIARKWATDIKRVPSHRTLVLSACGCFHGRTMVPVSMSCDPDTTNGFGPQVPGFIKASAAAPAAAITACCCLEIPMLTFPHVHCLSGTI